jgi:hypothetical protein
MDLTHNHNPVVTTPPNYILRTGCSMRLHSTVVLRESRKIFRESLRRDFSQNIGYISKLQKHECIVSLNSITYLPSSNVEEIEKP